VTSTWRRSGAYLLTVLLGLLLLTLLGVLSSRHDLQKDLSVGRRRTLAPQTVQILRGLEQPVHALAFYTEVPEERQAARRLLERYADRSRRFSFEFVDLDQRPELAELYGVSLNRTVVLTREGLQVRLQDPDEPALTAGLLRVLSDRPPRVLFLTGHGEASIADPGAAGLVDLAQLVRRQNFQVESWSLAGAERIPAEAEAVVLAAPEGEFPDRELDLLTAYVLQGGRLLALVEPGGSADVDSLLAVFGVRPEVGFLLDPSQEQRNVTQGAGPRIVLGQGANPEHPATADFTFLTVYPLARSLVSVQPPPPGARATRLVSTGEEAWLETDLDQMTVPEPVFDPQRDRRGPLTLAYAVDLDLRRFTPDWEGRSEGLESLMMDLYPELVDRASGVDTVEVAGASIRTERARSTRLAVVGDMDFVNNSNLLAWGNGDFFLAVLLWLTEREDRIALTPRPALFEPVVLTLRQLFWLRLVMGVGLPALFLLSAAGVVWQRRRWL
jgi:ABC-type uncharacterized transport system involved in gliding motility auxiliary subunit